MLVQLVDGILIAVIDGSIVQFTILYGMIITKIEWRAKIIMDARDVIIEALETMPEEYYYVTTSYSADGIVRERVFCYELYHRMRCIQETNDKRAFVIHGEIDKRGHNLFSSDSRKNPDFVFHVPGCMRFNGVVVEVKGKIDNAKYKDEAINDIKTLAKFTKPEHEYKCGIFLLYNYSLLEFCGHMRGKLKDWFGENEFDISKIEVICKKDCMTRYENKSLSEIMEDIT